MRILVVEDETYAADTLASLLRAKGHEATVAYEGAAGIATGIAGQFDGAVIDLGLGAVDGYEVAKALRAQHGSSLRLIAYTGFSGAEVRRRAHAHGFDRVVLKPAAVEAIVAALVRSGR